MSDEVRRRLLVLALLAALLFGYPVLVVADAIGRCCLSGALSLWIFFAWAVVVLLAWLSIACDRRAR